MSADGPRPVRFRRHASHAAAGRQSGGCIVMGNKLKTRLGAIGLAAGLAVGGSTIAAATLGSSSAAAAGRSSVTPAAVLPPGTTVKCTQISGAFQMRPGIGLTGSSSGVKWKLTAVANNCTVNTSAGTTGGIVNGAIIKGSGYFVGGNTCAAATIAANYGASTLKVTWIATPAVSATIYSTVLTGAFLSGTTTDATGLTQNRLNVGPTPVSLALGGDWTIATAAQLATDCAGPAPASRTAAFQTPTGSHLPAFVAVI